MHLACADPDASFDAQAAQGILNLARSANCAQRIVFVQLRYTEDCHDGIADEFLDGPAVAFDRLAYDVEVARNQASIDLGIQLGGEARRIDEVAEEDGDRASVRSANHDPLADCSERRFLLEDRLLERAQLFARLEPELVHQHASRVLVRLECVCLPPGAVERQHQLRSKAFPQRMLLDELLQLAGQVASGAQLEVGVDALLERRESRLLQAADLIAGERLEGEVLERRSSPERQRGAELLGPLARLGPAGLRGEPLEARQVESLRVDTQHISGRLGDDQLRTDRLSQP